MQPLNSNKANDVPIKTTTSSTQTIKVNYRTKIDFP